MLETSTHLSTAIGIILAYLIGSVSSAIIVCRIMRLPDPRKDGSGNPGTTNVLRIGGKVPALFTFVGDILKGVIPVVIARAYGLAPSHVSFILLAAFIGHLYPVFFQFKGGKGIATFFGGLIALSPLLGIAVLITWLVVAVITRYSSLAALLSSLLSLLYNWWLGLSVYYPALIIIVVFIYWRHRGNIERLVSGTESRIGKKNR